MAEFQEFENANRFRNYPFAEGAVLVDGTGARLDASMFIDAIVYPMNPVGRVRVSALDFSESVLEISDDTGVIGSGELGPVIELYSTDDLHRHMGCILTTDLVSMAATRREFDSLYLASACVCPIVPKGVSSITLGNTYMSTLKLGSGFTLSQREDPSGVPIPGEYDLSFSVKASSYSSTFDSIKTIYIQHDKGSIFGLGPYDDYSIQVNLGDISRDDICSSVHREDTLDINDTCDPVSYSGVILEDHSFTRAPETTVYKFDIAALLSQTFNIVAPVLSNGTVNPINVQIVDGTVTPNDPVITTSMSQEQAEAELRKTLVTKVSGNGIILQVPGLS